MRFRLLAPVLLLSSLSCPCHAQRSTPPPYRGASLDVAGIFVTPIAGVPLSATVTIESSQFNTDGSIENQQSTAHIARDGSGRIYNERRVLEPQGFQGESPLMGALIYDPVKGESTMLNPATHIARQRLFRRADSGNGQPLIPPGAKSEDLGTKALLGEQVHGTRVTQTVAGMLSGTGKPLQVVDEYWYSEELRLYLSVTHTDPRTGVQVVAISELHRVEPPATDFAVPAGYKLVDVNPPPDAPAGGRQ